MGNQQVEHVETCRNHVGGRGPGGLGGQPQSRHADRELEFAADLLFPAPHPLAYEPIGTQRHEQAVGEQVEVARLRTDVDGRDGLSEVVLQPLDQPGLAHSSLAGHMRATSGDSFMQSGELVLATNQSVGLADASGVG